MTHDPRPATSLGIDIGGTSIKLAALARGEIVWTGRSGRYQRPSTPALIDALRAAARGLPGPVASVGLCVPGLLDRAARRITLSVNVPGLVGIGLDALVAQSLGDTVAGAAVEICNDAVATAYDLYQTRHLRGRLLVIAIGTGVGAAVLDDGVPLIVEGDSPGHLGQFDVSVEGAPVIGPDGGAGGLEGYVGAAALAARAGGDAAAAVEALAPHDPPAKALVRTIRLAHAIYRPNHVVLAGGTGIRLGRLLPDLKRMVDTHLTSIARPAWTLAAGDSDHHAAAGAARLAARAAAGAGRVRP